MKAWTLRRRQEVDNLVKQQASSGGGAPSAGGGGAPAAGGGGAPWTEKHEKERTFQQQKRLKRAMDAMGQGALLPTEQVEVFGSEEIAQEALATHLADRTRKLAKYGRGRLRTRNMQNREPPTLNGVCEGKKIWMDRSTEAVLGGDAVNSRLRTLRAVRVSDRHEADVFLLQDVTSPGQRVMWNAMIGGLSLISIPFFLGQKGPMVSYQAAGLLHKKVWLSGAFIDCHPCLGHIICAGMEVDSNKWEMLNDSEFADIASSQRRQQKSKLLPFVVSADVDKFAAWLPARAFVTNDNAISKLAKLDRARSSMGLRVAGK